MDDFPFLLTLLGGLFLVVFSIECQDADQEAAAAGVSCLAAIGEVCPIFCGMSMFFQFLFPTVDGRNSYCLVEKDPLAFG